MNATENLMSAKRLTRNTVGHYVYEALVERAGLQVGVLSVENVTGAWLPARDGSSDTIRTYWVDVACSGEVRRKIVSLVRSREGRITSINLY